MSGVSLEFASFYQELFQGFFLHFMGEYLAFDHGFPDQDMILTLGLVQLIESFLGDQHLVCAPLAARHTAAGKSILDQAGRAKAS